MAPRKLKCRLDCDGQVVAVGKFRLRCKKCRHYYAIIKIPLRKPKLKLCCVISGKRKPKIISGTKRKQVGIETSKDDIHIS